MIVDRRGRRHYPAGTPRSKGGEYAPTAGWLGVVEGRLPPIGAAGAPPTPSRPRPGRPPTKEAPKPSTPPRPAARLMDEAKLHGWQAEVKYRRRPKSGDQWTVTLRRGDTEHVATWTKDPTTGRARYSGERRLKDVHAALAGQQGTQLDEREQRDPLDWARQLSEQIGARRQRSPYGGLSDVELRDAYDKVLSVSGGASEADLDAADEMWAELVRRDRERFDEGTRLDDQLDLSPEQLEIDDLISRGMDYLEAVRQVYGNVDLTDRRKGETQRAAIGRMYREWVALSYLAAEQAANGHLLSAAGRGRGVSARSLFSGPASRAAKYASPELLEFWETHPRLTLAQFTAQLTGRDTRGARVSRERMQDLGLKT